MLNRLRRWFCPDLGIDLGTANTLVAVHGAGIVVDEPSVVALERGKRQILGRGAAVGRLARQMLGRTPDSITAVRPLKDGVITDFELCEEMLQYFIRKALRQSTGLRPRVVIAVPGGITPVEKRPSSTVPNGRCRPDLPHPGIEGGQHRRGAADFRTARQHGV